MIIALNFKTVEIKTGGHAANAVIGLEYNGLMPVPCQLIGHGKAHRAGTQHCNPFTHG